MWCCLIGLLAACSDEEVVTPLVEEEVQIFTEMLIIESLLQDFSGPQRDTIAARYYEQLYDRFGIDASTVGALRDDYSRHPERWIRTMDTVAARIERNRTDLKPLVQDLR